MKKDFRERAESVVSTALTVQGATHLILSMGTVALVYMYALQWLASLGLAQQLAQLAASGIAMGAYFAVDGSLKGWLPYGVSVVVGGQDQDTATERMKWFNRVVVVVVICQLIVTGGLNFLASPEITEATTEQPDTYAFSEMATTAHGTYSADLERLERLAGEARQGIAQAEEEKASLIAAAIQSKGGEMARLYRSGNGWAQGELSGAIRSATRRGDQGIEQARTAYREAQAAVTAYMAANRPSVNQVSEEAATLTTAAIASVGTKKARKTTVLFAVMAASLFFFVFSTVMIVIYETETDTQVGDGLTVGTVAKGISEKTRRGVLGAIANLFRLKVAATPSPALAGARVVFPVHDIPDMPIGRSKSLPDLSDFAHTRPSQKSESRPVSDRSEVRKSESQKSAGQNVSERVRTEIQEEPVGVGDKIRSLRPAPAIANNTNIDVADWPKPGGPGWTKFSRKARGWFTYAVQTDDPKTRQTNLDRWGSFVSYCRMHGYEAVGDLETGKTTVAKYRGNETYEWTADSEEE